MAYSPHTWESQEYIRPAKMNHIEDGVASLYNISYSLLPESKLKAPSSSSYVSPNGVSFYKGSTYYNNISLSNFKDTYCTNDNYLSARLCYLLLQNIFRANVTAPTKIQIDKITGTLYSRERMEGDTFNPETLKVNTYNGTNLWVDPYYKYSTVPVSRLEISPQLGSTLTLNDPLNEKEVVPITAVYSNPITGAKMTATSAASDSLIIYKQRPTRLVVEQLPTKTAYMNGESIDLAGIVVKLYRGNEVWESHNYPGGVVPTSELILSKGIAEHTGNSSLTVDQSLTVEWMKYISDSIPSDDLVSDPFTIRVSIIPPAELRVSSTRTSFFSDETFDPSLLTFCLYDGNGNVWSNATYVKGVVPWSEIVSSREAGTRLSITSDEEGASEILSTNFSWSAYGNEVILNTTLNVTSTNHMIPQRIVLYTGIYPSSYNWNDQIVYTNVSVRAYDKNNALWIDSRYTNSNNAIPSGSLTYSVTRAFTSEKRYGLTEQRPVTISWREPVTNQVLTVNTSITVTVPIPSWTTGTNEEVAEVMSLINSNKLTVAQTGWAVGQEREVTLSAISNTSNLNRTFESQTVRMVLLSTGSYKFDDESNCHFVVGFSRMKEYAALTTSSGSTFHWRKSKVRNWCNEDFRAALPPSIRGMFKQFTNCTYEPYGNSYKSYTTSDYFSLFSYGNIGTSYDSSDVSTMMRVEINNSDKIPYLNSTGKVWSRLATDTRYNENGYYQVWTKTFVDGKTSNCVSIQYGVWQYSPTQIVKQFSRNTSTSSMAQIIVFGCI